MKKFASPPMLIKEMKKTIVGLCFSAIFLFGCSRENENGRTVVGVGGSDFNALADDAVLIKVGDRELSKRALVRWGALDAALLKMGRPELNESALSTFQTRHLPQLQQQFLPQSLYLAASRAAGLKPSEVDFELARDAVVSRFGGMAVRKFDAFTKKLDAEQLKLLEEQVAVNAAIFAYWRTLLPEAFTTPAEVFETATNRVEALNKQSAELLAQQRALAKEIYGQLTNGADFVQLANKHSVVKDEDEEGYVWGEFAPANIPYPELVPVVSRMKEGDVSAPCELVDGIHIVKLLKRTNPGAVGSVMTDPEEVTLGRIVLNLPEDYEVGSEAEIRRDWRDAKIGEHQEAWLKDLREKATVSYPSGTNLWSFLNKKGIHRNRRVKP